MICAYKGELDRHTLQGKYLKASFDRGIPTYLPDAHFENLSPLQYSQSFPNEQDLERGGRPVSIRLDSDPRALFFSINALAWIAKAHPASPIHAHIDPIYQAILPPGIEALPYEAGAVGLYYRAFDFRVKSSHGFLAPMHLKRNYGLIMKRDHRGTYKGERRPDKGAHPYDLQALHSCGLNIEQRSIDYTPTTWKWLTGARPECITIVRSGEQNRTTWAGLADPLAAAFRAADIPVRMLESWEEGSFEEAFHTIQHSTHLIACGHTPYTTLATLLGLTTRGHYIESLATEVEISQLEHYSNFSPALIDESVPIDRVVDTLVKGYFRGNDE